MPDTDITVVRRADSSGTTFVFTNHLSAISDEWKKAHGAGTTVNWPRSDKFVASPKNDGVTATIRQTPGSIGYVEFAFAKLAKLEMALLQNRAGQFVATGRGRRGRGARQREAAGLTSGRGSPTRRAPKSYPIATYTWMLFYKDSRDPKKAAGLREMVDFCLTEGQKMSAKLGYIPLPASVVAAARQAASNIQ